MMDLNDISRDTPLKHMLFDLFMAFNAIFPWHAPKQHVIWCIYGIFPWHALKNMSFDVHVEFNDIFSWHALKTCHLMYIWHLMTFFRWHAPK